MILIIQDMIVRGSSGSLDQQQRMKYSILNVCYFFDMVTIQEETER
jgi:hypothetical protein